MLCAGNFVPLHQQKEIENMMSIIISFKRYLKKYGIAIEDFTEDEVNDFMWEERLYGKDIFNALLKIKNAK